MYRFHFNLKLSLFIVNRDIFHSVNKLIEAESLNEAKISFESEVRDIILKNKNGQKYTYRKNIETLMNKAITIELVIHRSNIK